MGVEYTHAIVVADLSWRPTWQHVERLHDVLARWGFTRPDDAFYELTEDDVVSAAPGSLTANYMIVYDGLDGEPAARIMGPSLYPEIVDDDRYIMQLVIHLGVDFKVIQNEGSEIEVTTPPFEGGVAVQPREDYHTAYSNQSHYPATWATTPPKTDATGAFDGVWRSAILLDCNKDIPAFAEQSSKLPTRAFITELEAALGTKLVESGWFH